MDIYLSKPSGQKEGPFTLEQINSDLAANKYHDTEFWAWHEGLPDWTPLHSLPGVSAHAPANEAKPAAKAVPSPPPTPATPPVASGLPFAALEHIFAFTSGEGQVALQSQATAIMLQNIVGVDLATIRQSVPRDVIAHCDITERVRRDGAISDSAFRAMASLNLPLVQKAREGAYLICV